MKQLPLVLLILPVFAITGSAAAQTSDASQTENAQTAKAPEKGHPLNGQPAPTPGHPLDPVDVDILTGKATAQERSEAFPSYAPLFLNPFDTARYSRDTRAFSRGSFGNRSFGTLPAFRGRFFNNTPIFLFGRRTFSLPPVFFFGRSRSNSFLVSDPPRLNLFFSPRR